MIARRQLLNDAVKLLASDATVQLNHLRKLGSASSVDELVLEFDDIAAARDDMLRLGELSADEHRAIASLEAAVQAMSPADASLWTPEAVKHDMRWAKLRLHADECQRRLGDVSRGDV